MIPRSHLLLCLLGFGLVLAAEPAHGEDPKDEAPARDASTPDPKPAPKLTLSLRFYDVKDIVQRVQALLEGSPPLKLVAPPGLPEGGSFTMQNGILIVRATPTYFEHLARALDHLRRGLEHGVSTPGSTTDGGVFELALETPVDLTLPVHTIDVSDVVAQLTEYVGTPQGPLTAKAIHFAVPSDLPPTGQFERRGDRLIVRAPQDYAAKLTKRLEPYRALLRDRSNRVYLNVREFTIRLDPGSPPGSPLFVLGGAITQRDATAKPPTATDAHRLMMFDVGDLIAAQRAGNPQGPHASIDSHLGLPSPASGGQLDQHRDTLIVRGTADYLASIKKALPAARARLPVTLVPTDAGETGVLDALRRVAEQSRALRHAEAQLKALVEGEDGEEEAALIRSHRLQEQLDTAEQEIAVLKSTGHLSNTPEAVALQARIDAIREQATQSRAQWKGMVLDHVAAFDKAEAVVRSRRAALDDAQAVLAHAEAAQEYERLKESYIESGPEMLEARRRLDRLRRRAAIAAPPPAPPRWTEVRAQDLKRGADFNELTSYAGRRNPSTASEAALRALHTDVRALRAEVTELKTLVRELLRKTNTPAAGDAR